MLQVAGARPANREPFNHGAGYPSLTSNTYHPERCRELWDRRLRMTTSLYAARDRSARRSREKECLWNRSTRALAGNKDIPASCKLLRPKSITPVFVLQLSRYRVFEAASDYTAAAYE